MFRRIRIILVCVIVLAAFGKSDAQTAEQILAREARLIQLRDSIQTELSTLRRQFYRLMSEDPSQVKLTVKWVAVDLKEGPGNNADVLTELKRGDKLILLAQQDPYWKVLTETGQGGFVYWPSVEVAIPEVRGELVAVEEAPEPAPPPKRKQRTDARVWVDTSAGVYYCPDSQWYGKSMAGEYMRESQAKSGGIRAAYDKGC